MIACFFLMNSGARDAAQTGNTGGLHVVTQGSLGDGGVLRRRGEPELGLFLSMLMRLASGVVFLCEELRRGFPSPSLPLCLCDFGLWYPGFVRLREERLGDPGCAFM